jgi:hypothetical protein
VAVPTAAMAAAIASAATSEKEVVAGCGEEERRVAAGDAGAGGRERGVRVAVAAVEEGAAGEDQHRGDRPERDARHRPDPAAVDREHEEEDDTEHRHRAARPRERPGAEQDAQIELAARSGRGAGQRGGPGRDRRSSRRRSGDSLRLSRPRRRRAELHGCRRSTRFSLDLLAGELPELLQLLLHRVELEREVVESGVKVLDGHEWAPLSSIARSLC